jgi:hypothetical protein
VEAGGVCGAVDHDRAGIANADSVVASVGERSLEFNETALLSRDREYLQGCVGKVLVPAEDYRDIERRLARLADQVVSEADVDSLLLADLNCNLGPLRQFLAIR